MWHRAASPVYGMADVSNDGDLADVLGKPFEEARDGLRCETANALGRDYERVPVWIGEIRIKRGAIFLSETSNRR